MVRKRICKVHNFEFPMSLISNLFLRNKFPLTTKIYQEWHYKKILILLVTLNQELLFQFKGLQLHFQNLKEFKINNFRNFSLNLPREFTQFDNLHITETLRTAWNWDNFFKKRELKRFKDWLKHTESKFQELDLLKKRIRLLKLFSRNSIELGLISVLKTKTNGSLKILLLFQV